MILMLRSPGQQELYGTVRQSTELMGAMGYGIRRRKFGPLSLHAPRAGIFQKHFAIYFVKYQVISGFLFDFTFLKIYCSNTVEILSIKNKRKQCLKIKFLTVRN